MCPERLRLRHCSSIRSRSEPLDARLSARRVLPASLAAARPPAEHPQLPRFRSRSPISRLLRSLQRGNSRAKSSARHLFIWTFGKLDLQDVAQTSRSDHSFRQTFAHRILFRSEFAKSLERGMARPPGLEPGTLGLEGPSSVTSRNRPHFANSNNAIGYLWRLYFRGRQFVRDANVGRNRRI
jgi:hypothetical protein